MLVNMELVRLLLSFHGHISYFTTSVPFILISAYNILPQTSRHNLNSILHFVSSSHSALSLSLLALLSESLCLIILPTRFYGPGVLSSSS